MEYKGLRASLRKGALSPGGWIQIPHPSCAEILGRCGFEWICVDLEHGTIGLETLGLCCSAAEKAGAVPIARMAGHDPVQIRRALDAGARGIVVPMVNSGTEARAIVEAVRYPPEGGRGFGYCRANGYGADFKTYITDANRTIPVIVMIEHIDAIENLEEIVSAPGVDATFIGPIDLSGSLGVPGEMDHPAVQEALARYRKVCGEKGMTMGLHIVHPDQARLLSAYEDGYRMIGVGLDAGLLQQAAAVHLQTVRSLPPERNR